MAHFQSVATSYHIWRELQALGYGGSRSAVKYYLRGEKAKQERRESNRRRKQGLKKSEREAAPLSDLRLAIPEPIGMGEAPAP